MTKTEESIKNESANNPIITHLSDKSFSWKSKFIYPSLQIPGELNRIFDSFDKKNIDASPEIKKHLVKASKIKTQKAMQKWFIQLALYCNEVLFNEENFLKREFKEALDAHFQRGFINTVIKSNKLPPLENILRSAYIGFLLQQIDPSVRSKYANILNNLNSELLEGRLKLPKPKIFNRLFLSKVIGIITGFVISIIIFPSTCLLAIDRGLQLSRKADYANFYFGEIMDDKPNSITGNFWQGFKYGLLLPVWPLARMAGFISSFNKSYGKICLFEETPTQVAPILVHIDVENSSPATKTPDGQPNLASRFDSFSKKQQPNFFDTVIVEPAAERQIGKTETVVLKFGVLLLPFTDLLDLFSESSILMMTM